MVPAGDHLFSPPTQWTRPSWTGYIATLSDAMLIIHAAQQGLIPHITHQLDASERQTITSGSVFVFNGSCIKGWSDNIEWSPAHLFDKFLLYQQKNSADHSNAGMDDPDPSAGGSSSSTFAKHSSASIVGSSSTGIAAHIKHERALMDSLPNSDSYKADGFIKKVGTPLYLLSTC